MVQRVSLFYCTDSAAWPCLHEQGPLESQNTQHERERPHWPFGSCWRGKVYPALRSHRGKYFSLSELAEFGCERRFGWREHVVREAVLHPWGVHIVCANGLQHAVLLLAYNVEEKRRKSGAEREIRLTWMKCKLNIPL